MTDETDAPAQKPERDVNEQAPVSFVGDETGPVQPESVSKGDAELRYWEERVQAEGVLSHEHYPYFYTTHFGLDGAFYRGKRILDIGCGPRGSLEWADMAAERVGLDPLADRYAALGADRHRMKYIAAPAEQIPFPDGYFDVVCSFNSLDHVDDLDRAVDEIIRVLAPGGLFLLLTDLNHDPTECEPVVFSWEIVSRFTPALRVADERHFEKVAAGMYQSLITGVPYAHSNSARRYGILSVKFVKPSLS